MAWFFGGLSIVLAGLALWAHLLEYRANRLYRNMDLYEIPEESVWPYVGKNRTSKFKL